MKHTIPQVQKIAIKNQFITITEASFAASAFRVVHFRGLIPFMSLIMSI